MYIHGQLPPSFTSGNTKDLKAHVEGNFGIVEPQNARRYLNKIHYGEINPSIGDDALQGISKLPIEMKINLYEVLAEEGNDRNLEYLDALNQEMGLTEEFYAAQAEDVKEFFGDTKKIEKMWRAASGTRGTFAKAMNQMINHGEAMSERDKKNVLTFAAKSYAKHMGLEEPKIKFFADDPRLQGYFQRETGEIAFNTNSEAFKKDPMSAFNTAFHEPKHMEQCALAKAYEAGELSKTHKDYLAARVFAANMSTKGGYITADTPLGIKAYARQPSEVGARFAGDTAQKMATEIYGGPKRSAADDYVPAVKVSGYNA